MSKYKIIENEDGTCDVKEKTRTHTGVRWLTMENTVDSFKTLEEAQKKYPKAEISDAGWESWMDLCEKENTPSNG